MRKLKPGDRVTTFTLEPDETFWARVRLFKERLKEQLQIRHADRCVTVAVRRVGCNDPECPSCEGHWREEPVPPAAHRSNRPN